MALARGPYKIFEKPEIQAFDLLADAAQEAEFLHAGTKRIHRVQDANGEFVYESQGAPE